ncbi:MAG: peptidase S8, partial [Crocinitomicaceae bacterium]|nr:peptidase S8 [Crocinitomicaceae bacterium]
HGVLCVHAAGNDSKDVDYEPNFPTSLYSFQEAPLDHYITIGASTKDKENLVASFSNFGQTRVDIFAPGFEIYNTVPQSEYKNLQGTSMAAPMVSGVAALLKSYFPSLTMNQIKEVIFSTSVKYDDLNSLCSTGGVVNAYNAVKACMALEKGKK